MQVHFVQLLKVPHPLVLLLSQYELDFYQAEIVLGTYSSTSNDVGSTLWAIDVSPADLDLMVNNNHSALDSKSKLWIQ